MSIWKKEYGRKAYERMKADPERHAARLAKKRERYRTNEEAREKRRAAARKWKAENAEKVREYKRLDYQKHREKRREQQRAKYLRTREARLARERARRLANHDAILQRQRARRAANPEKFRELNRRHKQANPNAWRLYSTRKQAKQKGLAFDLDIEWFNERISAGVCEMSGLPFDLESKYGLGGRGPNSPSVDRRNPKGGYTKDNCRLILWWLNRALIDLGDDYCLNVFRAIFIKRGEMVEQRERAAA